LNFCSSWEALVLSAEQTRISTSTASCLKETLITDWTQRDESVFTDTNTAKVISSYSVATNATKRKMLLISNVSRRKKKTNHFDTYDRRKNTNTARNPHYLHRTEKVANPAARITVLVIFKRSMDWRHHYCYSMQRLLLRRSRKLFSAGYDTSTSIDTYDTSTSIDTYPVCWTTLLAETASRIFGLG
jgi:hypothetical protein